MIRAIPPKAKAPQPAMPARPGVQAKLTVGAADDAYEREADRVADQVMRAPAAGPPRISPLVQPAIDSEDDVQAKADGAVAAPAADFASRLSEAAGGAVLAPAARSFFEPRFGRDLGHVRIDSGAPAAALARDIHARAFAHGGHVYFGAGQYDAASGAGRRLLAHELTHVIQQGAGPAVRTGRDAERAE